MSARACPATSGTDLTHRSPPSLSPHRRRSCDSRNRSQRWEAEKPATRAPAGHDVTPWMFFASEVSAFAETLPAFLLSARPHSFAETARRPSPLRRFLCSVLAAESSTRWYSEYEAPEKGASTPNVEIHASGGGLMMNPCWESLRRLREEKRPGILPESPPRRRIRTGTRAESGGGLSDTEDA